MTPQVIGIFVPACGDKHLSQITLQHSLAFRGEADSPRITAIALEALGAAVLGYAGWLEGVLVNRNMIGVDHSYANAGKWSEASVATSGDEVIAEAASC